MEKLKCQNLKKENILKAKKFLIAKEAIKRTKFSETNLTSKRIGKRGLRLINF